MGNPASITFPATATSHQLSRFTVDWAPLKQRISVGNRVQAVKIQSVALGRLATTRVGPVSLQ
jgi:hypothetical protein